MLRDYLTTAMRQRGWNAVMLAERAGIAASTFSDVQRHQRPRVDTLEKIAQALDEPLWVLIEASGYRLDAPHLSRADVEQLARSLQSYPWMADRLDQLMGLSAEEFRDALDYVTFRRQRAE